MKWYNLIILTICIIWDMGTTIIGTADMFGDSRFWYGVLIAFVIPFFSLNTNKIKSLQGKSGFFGKFIWVLAISYDAVTSFWGNLFLVDEYSVFNDDIVNIVSLIVISVVTTGVPIIFSLINNQD